MFSEIGCFGQGLFHAQDEYDVIPFEFVCTIDIWAQATGCVQSEVCPEIRNLPLAQARSLLVSTLSQLQVGANGDASNSLGCLFKTRRANGEIAHDFLDLTSCWLAEVRGFGEIV